MGLPPLPSSHLQLFHSVYRLNVFLSVLSVCLGICMSHSVFSSQSSLDCAGYIISSVCWLEVCHEAEGGGQCALGSVLHCVPVASKVIAKVIVASKVMI